MLLARGAMPVQEACLEALATAADWPLIEPCFTGFRPSFFWAPAAVHYDRFCLLRLLL